MTLRTAALALLVALPPGARAARAQETRPYPFQDPSLPAEARISDLLSRMTLAEKIAALSPDASVPRLGVPGSGNTEGLHGVARGGPSNWGQRDPRPTTQFPQAVGMGETWDTALVRQMGEVESYEARYLFQHPKHNRQGVGGIVVWGPNADLARDIRWGRTEESFGEDPFLAGTLVSAEVRGLQGDDPTYWRAASLMKHFLANSNENERASSSSDFDERLFHEYYAMPFRMGVVQGGARAYMASYNAVNGTPMMASPILRWTVEHWGQDGIITSDGGALALLISAHHAYPDLASGAAAAVKAGLNQFLDRYREPVEQALARGLLSEGDIDRVLRGRYRVLIRLGQLDPPELVPYRRIGAPEEPEPWTTERHKALARRAAREAFVLLKNEGGLLPLDPGRVKRVAVIGPFADSVLLDWYSGTPPYKVSPLQGIRARLGEGAVTFTDGRDSAATAAAARAADLAIVVVGNHPECNDEWAKCPLLSEGKEAVDRRSIELERESIVRTAYGANRRTVLVLLSSFPYAIRWSQAHVPAVLHSANNGQELGNALADVLFGDFDPGGRLVHTWVRSLGDLPPRLDYDIRHGRTYMYFRGTPLYPFGYGLSYTTFRYANLRTSAPALPAGGTIDVSVEVKNTGARPGDEVVQLYVSYPRSAVSRPREQLVGFSRITLQAGEARTVVLPLPAGRLAYWDTAKQDWTVEPGPVRIRVGASSADIRLERTLQVTP
jgi:beta-glucosidase